MDNNDMPRTVLNITGSHHEKIQRLMAEWDRQQAFIVNRLIDWVSDQEPDIRGWILRTVSEQYEGDLARLILERAASRSRLPVEPGAVQKGELSGRGVKGKDESPHPRKKRVAKGE